MDIRYFKIFLIGFIIILLGTGTTHVQAERDRLSQAIEQAMKKTRNELSFENSQKDELVLAFAKTVKPTDLNTLDYLVKILDKSTGKIYSYWFDESLQPSTEKHAFDRRASAYQAKYGRLSRGLFSLIAETDPDSLDIFPVAIWAEQPAVEISNQVITKVDDVSFTNLVFLPIVASNSLLPIEKIVNFLSVRGYSPDYISDEVPVVYVNIPVQLILEIQAQPYVAAVFDQLEGDLQMESAARTSAAPWTWERGITGSGIKVAVLENDGVAFDNPYLYGVSYYSDLLKQIGDHATNVAGVIASTHDQQRGIAFGGEILSANAYTLLDWNVVSATDWAIDAGANIINASFGTTCSNTEIQSIDKYFDWVVWNTRTTAVISAGNINSDCLENYNVSSPGKAYNVITVGSKDDKNTASSESDVSDDQFSFFSKYIDPITASESRLKPEVVATGERIISTSRLEPWIEAGETRGTSFSAPIVAGEAALMMQRSSWLKDSPEAVKAGIMASARWTFLHDYPNYENWTPIAKMGVGAIDTTAADNSLINGRINELNLKQSDFSTGYKDIIIDLIAGQRIRVVITWSAHPSRLILNWILHDRLESDFDLSIISPSNQIFGSYADEANYEIVEFVAPQTGSYKSRIYLSRWDDSCLEERLGFAWYSGIPIAP